MIENSQQTRQTGSAIESFRNEMVQANLNSMKVLLSNKVMQKVEKKDNI